MWKHVVSLAVSWGFVCPLLAEVFPSGTTTINDERSYTSGEELSLPTGAKVIVGEGGSIKYSATSVLDVNTPVLTVNGGAELEISNGGLVDFTDFAGLVKIEGTADSPAKVTIDDGTLRLTASRYSGMSLLGSLQLGDYSILEVKGDGVFQTAEQAGTSSPRFAIFSGKGGAAYFKDNATLRMGDVFQSSVLLSKGYYEFSGNSVLDFVTGATRAGSSGLMIGCRGDAGDTVEVVLKDHARTANNNAYNIPGMVRLANPSVGTWSTLRYDSDQARTLGMICLVGVASKVNGWRGGSTFVQTAGYSQVGGNGGLHVAHVADSTTQVCTGIVCVAGGGLTTRANWGGNSETQNSFTGLIVARGPALARTDGDDANYAFGEFNLSDGAVTNEFGYVAIGTGRAVGSFVQTGGYFYDKPWQSRPLTVGLAGGRGTYVVSNGFTLASCDMYVGGAPVATSHAGVSWRGATSDGLDYAEDYTVGGAEGKLVVAAQDKTARSLLQLDNANRGNPGHLHVGANGTGSVEIGEAGSVICNGATFHGSSATLKFNVGEAGKLGRDSTGGEALAFLRIKGALVVESGAKLEVDASQFVSENKEEWVCLVMSNSETSTFDDVDIALNGPGEIVKRIGISRSYPSIYYHYIRPPRGTMLILR